MRFPMTFFALPIALVACATHSPPQPVVKPMEATAPAGRATDTFVTSKGELQVTPIFHASVLLEVAGQAIYLDPFSKGDFAGLPKADFILITDIHQDHMDAKALDSLSTPKTRIVAPPAVAKELSGREGVIVLENGKTRGLARIIHERSGFGR